MDLQQAKNLIQRTFNDSFDRTKFIHFIKELLNEIDEGKAKKWNNQYVKHAFHGSIDRYERIGTYTAPEGEKVDILIVYLEKETTLERARTLQRNFAAHHLKTRAEKDAGLVAFVSPNADDWRFSLVKMEYNLEKTDSGKVRVQEEITPSKRFSFIVGKNENSHTAQKQLLPILKEDKYNPTFKEIEEAFNIETVTKEFFKRYTELYFQFKEHLDMLVKRDEKLSKDFTEKEISTVDFAKKTLGQIVFLYFLQKKGWFGVAPDKKWGEGPKNFLRELFNRKDKYGDNFFNDVLEPLFYEALAQDRGLESIYPRLNNCRMPFLNGGLFEPIRNYSWETTDIVVPDELFSNDYKDPKTGYIGSGILDVFDRYNFTVKENDPLEKEVAVDPEMLGKVFENLLEIKDRKSKGAFYTPREIVHYMCQESLINYLESETNNEISREDLEFFIQKGDRIIENDKIALARKIEREKKYGSDKYKDSTYTLLLPESVRDRADKLDQLLRDIKVADPAVGSGAFPLGMINEIVRARKVLNIYIEGDISDYELKKHTITHSIYGVDLDPGAVDIAKLRLWLALVVDEETPHPLPNLEHKIMQGNSLISDYEGIKLFDESIFSKEKSQKAQQLALGFGKTSSELKMEALQDKIETFVNEAQRTKKQNLKKEIDDLKWDLIEASLQEQGKDDKLQEIKDLRHKNIKPFFIWKLEFSDVFKEKGGFDVVIGNPPYVSHDKIPEKELLKDQYVSYEPFADLYCYFVELGIRLIANKGIYCYITSNSYLRANYGKPLRNFLRKSSLLAIINIEESQVFDTAIVNTAVLIGRKDKALKEPCTVVNSTYDKVDDFYNFIQKNEFIYSQDDLNSDPWGLLSKVKLELKEKIKKSGESLEGYKTKIRLGLATGANYAFVIDEEKRRELVTKDAKNEEIIKPILRGRDIKKYSYALPNLYLILAKNGIDIKDKYPTIYEYLDSFGKEFKERGAQGQTWAHLRACSFFDDFKKEKIVWIELTNKGRFALCSEDVYLLNSAYFLIPPKELDTRYLLGILNSKVIGFYLSATSQTSGMGTNRWINIFVKDFPVPKTDIETEKKVIQLVEELIELSSKNCKKEFIVLNQTLNEVIYNIFGLNHKEIQIIENQ